MRKLAAWGLVLLGLALLSACGGGGGGGSIGSITPPPSSASNAVTMTVTGSLNMPYVSVKVCAPGNANNCQTVDKILVDTGSTGLRILSSALSGSLQASFGAQTVNSQQVLECAQFASGYTWGPVKTADVYMAGEMASRLPLQVISDPFYSTVPPPCQNVGSNAGAQLQANGILGVGMGPQDCGSACSTNSATGFYYLCNGATSCLAGTVPLAQQVSHPVLAFASDNNGVLLQLPAVPAAGSASVSGSLIFGIGTQSNNQIPSGAKAYATSQGSSYMINTTYQGSSYQSFIDSGSNLLYFRDASIPTCTPASTTGSWFCPPSPLSLNALISSGGSSSQVNFQVASAQTLLAGNNNAFNNIAAPASGVLGNYFDWGLPFFFGRNVFIAIDGVATPAGQGPLYIF